MAGHTCRLNIRLYMYISTYRLYCKPFLNTKGFNRKSIVGTAATDTTAHQLYQSHTVGVSGNLDNEFTVDATVITVT